MSFLFNKHNKPPLTLFEYWKQYWKQYFIFLWDQFWGLSYKQSIFRKLYLWGQKDTIVQSELLVQILRICNQVHKQSLRGTPDVVILRGKAAKDFIKYERQYAQLKAENRSFLQKLFQVYDTDGFRSRYKIVTIEQPCYSTKEKLPDIEAIKFGTNLAYTRTGGGSEGVMEEISMKLQGEPTDNIVIKQDYTPPEKKHE